MAAARMGLGDGSSYESLVGFLRRTLKVERLVQQLAGQSVYVGQPKTQASYRTIPIGSVVLEALAEHLRRYPAETEHFIFRNDRGGPIVRTSFTHSVWRPAMRVARLPMGTGLHVMRHCNASALIRAGLSVKVVAERLGHANAAMTLNVYNHLWPDDEDRTRQAVDHLLGAGADSLRTEQAAPR